MKLNSKLNRKQLALRLFAVAVVINGGLLFIFLPTSAATPTEEALPANMVELKVRGTLFTTFINRRTVMLTQGEGRPVGPVLLIRQDEDGLIVALSSELYRQHHQRLAQDNWAALPYIDGLLKTKSLGANYEIAY